MAIPMSVPRSAAHRLTRARLPWLASAAGAIALLAAVAADGRRGLVPANLAPAQADTVTLRIDAGLRHQVMEGFGATTLPLVYANIDPLPPVLRQQAIEALYRDIGVRTGNIEQAVLESPGDYAARRNDNDDPFVADPAGFQTDGLVRTRDKLLTPVLIDLDLGKVVITGMGYAIGQWARLSAEHGAG